MSTIQEIENAVFSLPADQQQALYEALGSKLRENTGTRRKSILEIQTFSVGEVLHPVSTEDDRLGEMLECS